MLFCHVCNRSLHIISVRDEPIMDHMIIIVLSGEFKVVGNNPGLSDWASDELTLIVTHN